MRLEYSLNNGGAYSEPGVWATADVELGEDRNAVLMMSLYGTGTPTGNVLVKASIYAESGTLQFENGLIVGFLWPSI